MELSDLLITSTLILQVWFQLTAAQDYKQECSAWDDVVSKLNRQDEEMTMYCQRNQQCTGADCFGKYQYQEVFQSGKQEVMYCFGVALHPCRKPTDLHFYVETLHKNETFQQNVSATSTPYDTGIGVSVRGGHADLYIKVAINRTVMNNKKYMEIEMQSKVKVSFLGIYDQWPENHQKVLIPPILVPVPDCDSSVVTPNYAPGTCAAPASTVAPPSTKPPKGKQCKQKLKDGTYNAHVCGEGEMCGDKGYCVCLFDYIRVNDTCVLGQTTIRPYVFTDSPAHAKKSTTIIIVVGVAVVAFLGMLAVGFFIVKYRKYKARYGNHQLLNEDDNNAPDDPLDDEAEDDPPLDLST